MSSTTKWVIGVVVVIIIIGAWYLSQSSAPASQGASVANSAPQPQAQPQTPPSSTAAATASARAIADISAALKANDAVRMTKLQGELKAATAALAALAPQLQAALNVRFNSGKVSDTVMQTFKGLAVKLSYLQSTTLSLANAQATVDSLNASLAIVASANTALQAAN